MTKNRIISFLLLVVLLFNIVGAPAYALTNQNYKNTEFKETDEDKKHNDNVPKQKFLVKYKDEDTKGKIEKKIKDKGGKVLKDFKNIKSFSTEIANETLESLEKDPYVELIEPDFEVQVQEEDIPWGIKRIEADKVHAKGFLGDSINVAVFDTGISTQHEDLNVKDGVSFVDDTSSYDDDNGHGTHVAGILAAQLNNDGIVGAAPKANLFAAKVIKSNGTGNYSDIIEAIDWAIDNDINVINMSFGGDNYSKILEEAINSAYQNNIIIIASAGNNGSGITYPAKYENVIAVGAVDENNDRASFSSIGPELELMAPGVYINSTLKDGSYGFKSGTSMAAPHVAGAAALLWSKNEEVSNETVRDILKYSAVAISDKNEYCGNGLINLTYALEILKKYGNKLSDKNTDKKDRVNLLKELRPIKEIKTKKANEIKKDKKDGEKKDKKEKDSYFDVEINNGDLFSNAITMSVGTTVSEYVYAGEEDYFKLTIPKTDYYYIQTTGSTDTYGVLYDSSESEMKFDDDSGSGRNFGITSYLEEGQTYYLKVRGYNSATTGEYSLRVDGLLDKYGNSFSSAEQISVNTLISGGIQTSGDVDYFKFTISKTDYYYIQTTGITDTWGYLYDSSESLIKADDDSGSGRNFGITNYLKEGQTYYLKVKGYNTTTGDYSLRIDGLLDKYGNSFSSAEQISANTSIPGEIQTGGDVDFFKFTAQTSGSYTIQTTGDIDTYGYLYNSSESQLVSNDDGGDLRNFKIAYDLTVGQTYYVKVRHFNSNSTGSYMLKINAPTPSASDDYGNTFSLAEKVSVDTSIAGEIEAGDDVDFFEFTAPTSGKYTVQTTGDTDTYGYLYNSSESQLNSDNDGGSGANFEITDNLTAGQTYYVKVRHNSSTGIGSYTLNIQRHWYYFETSDLKDGDTLKIYMTHIGDEIDPDDVVEARIIHNNDLLISQYIMDSSGWNDGDTYAYNPDGGIGIAAIESVDNSVSLMGLGDIIKEHIDLEALKNKLINKVEEKLGINITTLTAEQRKSLIVGVAISTDDNMFFGIAQKLTGRSGDEDDYYYMRARTFADACFVSAYTVAAVGSAAEAIRALKTAGLTGSLAIASAPSGVGGVAFGTVAVAELAEAAAMTGIAYASTKMMNRSHDIFSRSSQILQDMMNRVEALVENYTQKVLSKFKVSKQYPTSYTDSQILREELKLAGIDPPPYPNAAHHIVPSSDPRSLEARQLLEHFDIDYNSAANGVFLPYERNTYVVSEAMHVGNHSPNYITEITEALKDVKNLGLGQAEAIEELNNLRKRLLRGLLHLN